MRSRARLFAAAVFLSMIQLPAPVATTASAQGYSNMSCGQLWYARNRYYADAGYCFKTARARRTFGAGCFPPYGQLSGYAKEQVEIIKSWEARLGC
ncbi:MAG: YARHG domain-containing protein [Hyphomicrobiales bacterium]|nr:YARHG domain-containing protein [Hyphomicrobiales bacterium]